MRAIPHQRYLNSNSTAIWTHTAFCRSQWNCVHQDCHRHMSVRSAPVNSILYSVERVQDQTSKDQTRRTNKVPHIAAGKHV